jgi:hypothetical protein
MFPARAISNRTSSAAWEGVVSGPGMYGGNHVTVTALENWVLQNKSRTTAWACHGG